MESVDPQLSAVAILTMGIGVAMTWLGTRTGLLEFRARRRRCPSCGHAVTRNVRCRCVR